jgi:hypothetical protein
VLHVPASRRRGTSKGTPKTCAGTATLGQERPPPGVTTRYVVVWRVEVGGDERQRGLGLVGGQQRRGDVLRRRVRYDAHQHGYDRTAVPLALDDQEQRPRAAARLPRAPKHLRLGQRE